VTFQKVASLNDLWSGEMLALDVGDNSILLVNIDEHIYAYANACPHQKSRLNEGNLIGKTLRCARHHWEFDVCTGNGINPQNACLKVFPVRIESRDILLNLDDPGSAKTVPDGENQG
jgi:toluene monooxygenase system ferredoxin subunit